MFLPSNATIAEEKLTKYLLVHLLKDDGYQLKAKTLIQRGSQPARVSADLTVHFIPPYVGSQDDKSKFLQQAGYTLDNWQQLEVDLRSQVLIKPAQFVEQTLYGKKYKIQATLTGVNGVKLDIITIWMVTDQQVKFVTLVPNRYSQQE